MWVEMRVLGPIRNRTLVARFASWSCRTRWAEAAKAASNRSRPAGCTYVRTAQDGDHAETTILDPCYHLIAKNRAYIRICDCIKHQTASGTLILGGGGRRCSAPAPAQGGANDQHHRLAPLAMAPPTQQQQHLASKAVAPPAVVPPRQQVQ